MSFVSKIISSPKRIFFFLLLCVYIAMVTYALPPYGVIPAMSISLMAPLSIFLIAYPTYYILLPRLMNGFIDEHDNLAPPMAKGKDKKKYFKYYYLLGSLLLIVVAMAFIWMCLTILYGVFDLPQGNFPAKYSRLQFLNPSLFVLTYISTNIFYVHNRHHDYMDKITIEKKDLEMKMLKLQINSHFLFNALNNIYSMTYFENKEAPKYVAKLSQMLRYVLEDCEADHVPLSGEISYIENFIDFQRARFETAKDVTFNFTQNHIGEIQIPPMIFQPLIENCFKYCPLQNDKSFIHIEIVVEQNLIRFVAENTQPLMKQPADKTGSIGLENLKNRLALIYKNNYCLDVFDEEDVYRVELTISI